MDVKPGEHVIKNVMKTFIKLSINKVEKFTVDENEKTIRKGMKHNEDTEFQNVLHAINACSENSLPSLLRAILDWHSNNHSQGNFSRSISNKSDKTRLPDVCQSEFNAADSMGASPNIINDTVQNAVMSDSSAGDNVHVTEKRDLGVDYIFCQSVMAVLKQLHVHPGHDEMITNILTMAFTHFKYRDDLMSNPNNALINEIADMYADVVGVVSQNRFNLVRIKFTGDLKVLRSKEVNSSGGQSIISLLMGMKFFRVKMYPIEDFVECFNFLTELANYFLEVDDKKIKHALAGLFVEVLLPVAAVVKNEVNIPVLRTFVDYLYNPCVDMCSKKKHFSALSPLVTCLLSVSQKHAFLSNWPAFMITCLSQLKNRDPSIARVALESLFRLLWVYIVRIKGEKHTDTQSKLHSIVNSLFPKGSKFVTPRDASINIFVKIIHFIAQEKLDFAMKEIIFDLIGANRSHKVILPERMNIGLCAFLLIALSLQQKEGEPPMPQKSSSDSNNSSQIDGGQSRFSPYHNSHVSSTRISKLSLGKLNQTGSEFNNQSKQLVNKRKTSYTFMTLNDTNAASIGINSYINQVRKAFDTMLRLLDQQVIRTMLLTKQENINKEFDDVMTAERKPKIDLLKTCISAIPRLLPADMTKSELVELLSRLSIHIDEELRMMSQQALVNIIQEFPNWRFKTVQTYLQFVRKEISDSSTLQLESSLKILYHLINAWKNAIITPSKDNTSKSKALDCTLLDDVEGFCLVMLCQYRSSIRRLSVHILKEVKILINQINTDLEKDNATLSENSLSCDIMKISYSIDSMDKAAPAILRKCLSYLPINEKCYLMTITNLDFMTLAERSGSIWGVVSNVYNENQESTTTEMNISTNLWIECIAIIFSGSYLLKSCPSALSTAWPLLMERINHLFSIIDPSAQIAENRTSSILRGGSSNKKPLSSTERDHCMLLWKCYITAACCITPLSNSQITGTIGKYQKSPPEQSSFSTDTSQTKPTSVTSANSSTGSNNSTRPTSKDLLKILVPLIKCEASDLRDSVIEALGHFNPIALRDIMDEMQIILRESVEKKQENVRRRKRKDCLRLYLVKILELWAYNGMFDYSEEQSGQLANIVDWLEQLKPYLISGDNIACSSSLPSDSTLSILTETRLHFCQLIRNIILNAPKEKRLHLFGDHFKQNLFWIIANWTGVYSKFLFKKKWCKNFEQLNYKDEICGSIDAELCFAALSTMCSLLCCGPVFESQSLQEDGFVLPWLINLINSKEEKLMILCEETIILLLDFNSETHTFLDVMIDCCYTGSNTVIKIAFLSIVRTFNHYPDYPCDYISLIILSLVFTSSFDSKLRENALQLLQLLYHRFFIDSSFVWSEYNAKSADSNNDISTSSPISNNASSKFDFLTRWQQIPLLSQDEISKDLAETLSDLTLSVFSEITQRIPTANPHLQMILLNCLIPWMYNLELIDFIYPPSPQMTSPDTMTHVQHSRSKQRSTSPCPISKPGLSGCGWGSRLATDLVLNNLFYLTVKFGQELNKSLEIIWACLIRYRSENLIVTIHYLIVITSLTPTSLLPFAKQVILYLAKEKPKKLIEHLFSTLQTIDGLSYSVERTQSIPFYRLISTNITVTTTNFPNNQLKTYSKSTASSDSMIIDTNLGLGNHDKGVLNNIQQLPVASIRSSTLDNFQAPRKNTDEITEIDYMPSLSSYAQSAPGTLCLNNKHEIKSEDNIINLQDEDKYATLKPKDIRKTSGKVNIPQVKPKELAVHSIHPLPLPAYGGYSAPLNQYLIDEQCPIWTHSYKSSIVLMFFIDIIPISNTRSFWERDLELLLHCIILGLDHKEYLVYEQCKLLLIKILHIHCPEYREIKILNLLMMGSNTLTQKSQLCLNGGSCQPMVRMQTCDVGRNWENILSDSSKQPTESSSVSIPLDAETRLQRTLSSYSVTSTCTLIPSAKSLANGQAKPNLPLLDKTENIAEKIIKNEEVCTKNDAIVELVKIISSCRDQPLWSYEYVTISKYINDGISTFNQSQENKMTPNSNMSSTLENDELILIPSVNSLRSVVRLICDLIDVDGTLAIKWAHLALNTGVNCTHRHYASRSLQIFRALGTTFDGAKLSALFSRLLDTIGDLNEDVQCYVVELFLTLECGIKNLKPQDMFSSFTYETNNSDVEDDDLYRSTPNLKKSYLSPKIGYHKDPSRQRGTTVGGGFRIIGNPSRPNQRCSAIVESTIPNKQSPPKRPLSLKTDLKEKRKCVLSNLSWDERTDLACELFWIANILMESELEHELYAGIRFLHLLICCLNNSHIDFRTKLEKTMHSLNWNPSFPGTIHLLIKGCFNSNFSIMATQLLSRLVLNVNCSLADPSQKHAFPFTVLTLLVSIFDEETASSRMAARNIANMAKLLSPDRLGNLITVMQLYSGGTFNKDHTQWTRCVVKYLFDGYNEMSGELLAFVNRMLVESHPLMYNAILQVITNFVHYINMADNVVVYQLNIIVENINRIFINSAQWKDAYPILRLIVSRNSSLALPTNNVIQSAALHCIPMVPLPEAETPRLELPGRTLEYRFDIREYCEVNYLSKDESNTPNKKSTNQKTKELLLQLINSFGTYGFRAGFSKSPSVIFSQSTETLEHQVSLHSSSETTSTNDISLADDLRLDETSSVEQAQVFRDLDEYLDAQLKMNFLDLPDDKWEDDRKPSWGVRSQSITHYDFPDSSNNTNQSINKTGQSLSTSGDQYDQNINCTISPSKTLPCRNQKSPNGKNIGGPRSNVTSPQIVKTELSVPRPQSLSIIHSTPNLQKVSKTSFKSFLESQDGKVSTSSSHFGESKLKCEHEPIFHHNSPSSEEDINWTNEKVVWVSRKKVKDISSSSSDEVDDDEDDIDEDESLCIDELNNLHKHGHQNRRLYTSSVDRSSSNNYEKETESIWFESLNKALNTNVTYDEVQLNTPHTICSGFRYIATSEWLSNLWVQFPLVFEDCSSKCRGCITESIYYLSMINDLSDIGSHFGNVISHICKKLATPLFYLGGNHFDKCESLVDSQKLTMMQLLETYDKFCNHMEYAIEILDLLKRSSRVSHWQDSVKPDEKRVNLCRHLHKMLTQLLLMHQSHCHLLFDIKTQILLKSHSVKDVSTFIQKLAGQLEAKIGELNKNSQSQDLESKSVTNVYDIQQLENEFYEALLTEDIDKAVSIWRMNRVGFVVFNKALESNNPVFHLMQMFCTFYAKDNRDLLVYVNAEDITNRVDSPQEVSNLAMSLVPLSTKITKFEKEINNEIARRGYLRNNTAENEASVANVTSDSSIM